MTIVRLLLFERTVTSVARDTSRELFTANITLNIIVLTGYSSNSKVLLFEEWNDENYCREFCTDVVVYPVPFGTGFSHCTNSKRSKLVFIFCATIELLKQGGMLNDRQRATLGIVAIFSLVGVATLSLFLMNAGSGGVIVTADTPFFSSQSLRCANNPEINGPDFNLKLTRSEISLENTTPSPLTNLKITFYDVLNPSVESGGEPTQLAAIENGYVFVVKLGENGEQVTKNFPYTFVKNGGSPCVRAEVSTDGIAYHSVAASLLLNN